jgi:hypothetical protein
MDDHAVERIAKNDAAFRALNEQLSDAATELGINERVPFICECAEPSCTTIVRLSSAEYAQIRSQPTHFLNAPGHQVAAQGAARVVEERQGYVIVEKIGRGSRGRAGA